MSATSSATAAQRPQITSHPGINAAIDAGILPFQQQSDPSKPAVLHPLMIHDVTTDDIPSSWWKCLPTSAELPNTWKSAGFYQHLTCGQLTEDNKATADKLSLIVLNYLDLSVRQRQIFQGLHERDFDALVEGFKAEWPLPYHWITTPILEKNNYLPPAITMCRTAEDAYTLVESVVERQFRHVLPLIGGSTQDYFALPMMSKEAFISGNAPIARGAVMKTNRTTYDDPGQRVYRDLIPSRLWMGLKKEASAEAGSFNSSDATDVLITVFGSYLQTRHPLPSLPSSIVWNSPPLPDTLPNPSPNLSNRHELNVRSYCMSRWSTSGSLLSNPKETSSQWADVIRNTVLDPSRPKPTTATVEALPEQSQPAASTATAAQGTAATKT